MFISIYARVFPNPLESHNMTNKTIEKICSYKLFKKKKEQLNAYKKYILLN